MCLLDDADVMARDFDGQPLLSRVIKDGAEKAVLFLLEHGANINERYEGKQIEWNECWMNLCANLNKCYM